MRIWSRRAISQQMRVARENWVNGNKRDAAESLSELSAVELACWLGDIDEVECPEDAEWVGDCGEYARMYLAEDA